MRRFLPRSLKVKVQIGYCFFLSMILITIALSGLILHHIYAKVTLLQVIEDFNNTILEVRRFEKNYLLYHDEEALVYTRHFLGVAEMMLSESRREMAKITSPDLVQRLWTTLSEYRKIFAQVASLSDPPADLIARLRQTGKELVRISEMIEAGERRSLERYFQRSMALLFLLAIYFIGITVGLGYLVARMVVLPLKNLEGYLKRVASGNFTAVYPESADSEIQSVVQTMRLMLEEIKAREEELVQSKKLASLGTLLSGVAHELNNPLSNIYSSCQILLEDFEDLDPRFLKDMLIQIEKQTWRARNIVRTLLEFSRQRQYVLERHPLRPLVEEVFSMVRGQLPARVSLQLAIPPDLDVWVDKQRLQQALLNLVTNAIQAIGEEGEVRVEAQETDRGVEIRVIDNGCGIPPEIKERIFDPFFTTKEVGKGSGLGLYITHEIIKHHGGKISVTSVPGQGTTFTIVLPQRSLKVAPRDHTKAKE